MKSAAHLEIGDPAAPGGNAAKLGLWVFMAVVATLFSLLIAAYVMRMAAADWRALPLPRQLWFNTALLVVSSLALQRAQRAAQRGQMHDMRTSLLAAGLFAVAFLAGQLWAWRQLGTLNYLIAGNPANSFFYLLTGLHGLHLLGGLAACGKTGADAWRGMALERTSARLELCRRYWHFLLALWLILLGVLLFVTPALIQALCGPPV